VAVLVAAPARHGGAWRASASAISTSVASDAIMNGVPLEVVGKMLGHRNYHTTQRYAHIADNVLRDAVNMTSKTIVQAGQDGTSKGRKAPKSRSRTPR